MSNGLVISEEFYSIQGEGVTIGMPTVFLRLTGCNLTCPGWATDDNPSGCDTTEVWKKGDRHSFEDILSRWEENGFIEAFNKGAHLVITGGEPLLQQEALIEFLAELDKHTPNLALPIEIETNGTIVPDIKLLVELSYANVSIKLNNSGNDFDKRYVKEAVEAFARFPFASFKFVVSSEEDIAEIQEMQEEHRISNGSVLLMPMGSSRNDLALTVPAVVELCKKHGYRFSPREHITIWDMKVGV